MLVASGLFAFLHIPKCAGTYIRKHLRDKSGAFGSMVRLEEPAQGLKNLVKPDHITLEQASRLAPNVIKTLRSVEVFALLREPSERFTSSFLQYQKEYAKPELLVGRDPVAAAHKIMDRLCEGDYSDEADRNNKLGTPLVHFRRQRDYVYLEEEKLARRLGASSDPGPILEEMLDLMPRSMHVEEIDSAPLNSSETVSQEFNRIERYLERLSMPSAFLNVSKKADRWLGNQIQRRLSEQKTLLSKEIDQISDLRSRIEAFYSRDYELFYSLRGR